MPRRALAALVAVAALALTACGSADEEGTTLRVAAASSLGVAFEELAQRFEEEHPDVDVQLQLAGSSTLAAQIRSGAPVDVFASADEPTMQRVDDVAKSPTVFATNVLTVITRPGNPDHVQGLADLEREDLAVVVCAPRVPCGAATQELLRRQGVDIQPVSEASKVTDVLAKVRTGQADAGLVYATDARAAGEAVETIQTRGADEVVNRYPIATLATSEEPRLAREFVDLTTGPEGRAVLSEQGFGAP